MILSNLIANQTNHGSVDYLKGDSSYFFTQQLPSGETLSKTNKELIRKYVLKSLSQKGDLTQGLTISSINDGAPGADGQKYLIVEFR